MYAQMVDTGVAKVGDVADMSPEERAFQARVDDDIRIEPDCPRNAGHQLGGCEGVFACEQGNVVALPHQFFSQVGDNAFGAAIETRGYALEERCDLRDFHS